MTVFASTSSIITDTTDLAADNSLPDAGMLSLGSIGSDTAFGGVAGKDCMLVRGGDVLRSIISGGQQEQMDNDLSAHIKGNETHTVDQNTQLIFHGNLDLGVDMIYHVTVQDTGGLLQDIKCAVTNHFFKIVMETYDMPHNVDQPEDFIEKKWNSNTLCLDSMNFCMYELEVVISHMEFGSNHFEVKVSHPEVKVFNAYSYVGQTEAGLTTARVQAMKGDAGVTAKARAALNVLASIGIGTPFR